MYLAQVLGPKACTLPDPLIILVRSLENLPSNIDGPEKDRDVHLNSIHFVLLHLSRYCGISDSPKTSISALRSRISSAFPIVLAVDGFLSGDFKDPSARGLGSEPVQQQQPKGSEVFLLVYTIPTSVM